MNITPSFQGEVQFRRYSDTSTQGQQIVLTLQDREALQAFIGLEGKRFMAVLVQIGDDEQPIPPNSTELKQREHLGDLCWRAVQWCRDPEFWSWVNQANPEIGYLCDTEDMAKDYICTLCGIESRKELDTNQEAATKFHKLIRGPFQKYLIARGITR